MKNHDRWHPFIGAVLMAVTACAARAQVLNTTGNPDYGTWYFRAGAGPELMQNSSLTLDFSRPDVTVKFDPGFRLDVTGGYRFGPYFSLEGTTGMTYNSIDSIAGSPATSASLIQIPFLANAVFQLPNQSRWTPYLGGGCGFSVSAINIDHAVVQGGLLHGNAAATAFAYDAFAGVRYHVNPRSEVSLGYEFLGTSQPEWDVTSLDSTRTFGTLVLRHPFTHSLVAAFTFRF
jgi:opacity protein-like surface antigen